MVKINGSGRYPFLLGIAVSYSGAKRKTGNATSL
jgi:hypothetical protein